MSNPPKSVTDAVDRRDDYSCIRCGTSLTVTHGSRHHRLRRRVGGHRVSNLILLCGSGTTGCHGWVHSNPKKAQALGFTVPANHRPDLDPEVIPIKTLRRGWVVLHDDESVESIPEAQALELLAAFGIIRPLEVSA